MNLGVWKVDRCCSFGPSPSAHSGPPRG